MFLNQALLNEKKREKEINHKTKEIQNIKM